MTGIYIHVPFCKQACSYCNFHFSTSLRLKDDMVEAIIREIHLRAPNWPWQAVDTIYFGGGTPSLLSGLELSRIYDALSMYFDLSNVKESTLEANPDDLTPEKLKSLADSPINRLSIGIQSFIERDLQYMNRAHTSEEAHKCIEDAYKMGFDQLTIDLIYGVPGLTSAEWEDNLNNLFQYDIPHLSCYALTVEPKTALHHQIKTGKSDPPDEALVADQFQTLQTMSEHNGYEHYEISNFAKDKQYARHNTSYWFGKPYLGLGPSAHSYDGQHRQWNVANNPKYIKSMQSRQLAIETEYLSDADRYNEMVLCRMRTMWGMNKADLEGLSEVFSNHFLQEVKPYIDNEKVIESADGYQLSRAGKLLADKITSDLFYID